jgi:hypothetical protein
MHFYRHYLLCQWGGGSLHESFERHVWTPYQDQIFTAVESETKQLRVLSVVAIFDQPRNICRYRPKSDHLGGCAGSLCFTGRQQLLHEQYNHAHEPRGSDHEIHQFGELADCQLRLPHPSERRQREPQQWTE